jgi:hypothetical protein
LIPVELALKVFRNSPAEKKKFNEFVGLGHYDPLPLTYWYGVREFVNSVDPPLSESPESVGPRDYPVMNDF